MSENLHVFVDDNAEEWFVARDLDHLEEVVTTYYGCPYSEIVDEPFRECWRQLPDEETLDFWWNDDLPDCPDGEVVNAAPLDHEHTKQIRATCGQWAASQGPGYLAGTNW